MLSARLKRTRAAKSRMNVGYVLMLTSMLDIFTTILFFLLKNYTSHVTGFTVGKDLVLPQSTALIPPPGSSLSLVITQNAILLDDKQLVSIVNGDIARGELFKDGVTIVKLAQALQAHKKRSKYIESRNDAHSFTGTIIMQADKDLKFHLLKKVIYTAGITDFVLLKLAVLKKEA